MIKVFMVGYFAPMAMGRLVSRPAAPCHPREVSHRLPNTATGLYWLRLPSSASNHCELHLEQSGPFADSVLFTLVVVQVTGPTPTGMSLTQVFDATPPEMMTLGLAGSASLELPPRSPPPGRLRILGSVGVEVTRAHSAINPGARGLPPVQYR